MYPTASRYVITQFDSYTHILAKLRPGNRQKPAGHLGLCSSQTLRSQIHTSKESNIVSLPEFWYGVAYRHEHRRALGPGAESLLPVLTNPELPEDERVDTLTKIKDMTVADWALVVRAFDNWPFAPEVCSSHFS